MTAPSPFCAVHPFGTATMCGPCRDRRRHADAEKAYESALSRFWLGRLTDAHGAGRDDDDSVTRLVGDVRLTVSDEGNDETSHPVSVVGVDRAHALMQVVDPEVVRVGRVKVENGSVVVQLDSHGRKRIARRVLTAAAVAAVALWAVAS